MKALNSTTIYAELASARDQVAELGTRMYQLNRTASQVESPEGRLLSARLREIQLALVQVEDQLNVTALCYTD